MAHKTRKRLSKTELKRDPVNDFLLKSMTYLKEHLTLIASVLGGLLIVILIVQAFSGSSKRQGDEAAAGLYLAGQLYQLGMSSFQSGMYDQAMGQLQTARNVAQNNYRAYPGRDAGRWSMLLQAKIGIVFGQEDEVVEQLQEFLATRPGDEFEAIGNLYLASALENRGGGADVSLSRELYGELLASEEPGSQIAWEAENGLTRLDLAAGDYASARRHLEAALAVFPDTTEFVQYQFSMLSIAGY